LSDGHAQIAIECSQSIPDAQHDDGHWTTRTLSGERGSPTSKAVSLHSPCSKHTSVRAMRMCRRGCDGTTVLT
jgi:hypothetical protein